MNFVPFVNSINEARKEIAALGIEISRLEALYGKRKALEEFVRIAEAVIGGDEVVKSSELRPLFAGLLPETILPPAPVGLDGGEERLWKVAHTVLQMNRRPMTATEVLTEIDKTDKGMVAGEHRRETVRGAMNRKEDVFEKVGRGLYALREWPDQIKYQSQGDGDSASPDLSSEEWAAAAHA